MRNKNKENSKVPKSAKTRLSDLAPKKDARGGRLPEAPFPDGGPQQTPPGLTPPVAYPKKKYVTL